MMSGTRAGRRDKRRPRRHPRLRLRTRSPPPPPPTRTPRSSSRPRCMRRPPPAASRALRKARASLHCGRHPRTSQARSIPFRSKHSRARSEVRQASIIARSKASPQPMLRGQAAMATHTRPPNRQHTAITPRSSSRTRTRPSPRHRPPTLAGRRAPCAKVPWLQCRICPVSSISSSSNSRSQIRRLGHHSTIHSERRHTRIRKARTISAGIPTRRTAWCLAHPRSTIQAFRILWNHQTHMPVPHPASTWLKAREDHGNAASPSVRRPSLHRDRPHLARNIVATRKKYTAREARNNITACL